MTKAVKDLTFLSDLSEGQKINGKNNQSNQQDYIKQHTAE
jgi:Cu/Ag efflux protein CusF